MSRQGVFTSLPIVTVAFLIAGWAGYRYLADSAASAGVTKETGFPSEFQDLGEAPWNEQVNFALQFQNGDDRDIEIATISSSCGCTTFAADWHQQIIPPNQSLTLNGKLATGNNPGELSRSISVVLCDGRVYECPLRLKVIAGYEVTPSGLRFDSIDIATDNPGMHLLRFRSKEAKLLRVTSDSAWLTCDIGDTVVDGAGIRETALHVIANPRFLAFGNNTGRLTIFTSDQNKGEYGIGVAARGHSAVRAIPSFVVLREDSEQAIQLIGADGTRKKPHKVASDSDLLRFEVRDDSIRVRVARIKSASTESVLVEDTDGNKARFQVALR